MQSGLVSAFLMNGNGNMRLRATTVGHSHGEAAIGCYLRYPVESPPVLCRQVLRKRSHLFPIKVERCSRRAMSRHIQKVRVRLELWIWLGTSGSGQMSMWMSALERQSCAAAAIRSEEHTSELQ